MDADDSETKPSLSPEPTSGAAQQQEQHQQQQPPKKKQKRNKPTLSCEECVERKTKVSAAPRRIAVRIFLAHSARPETPD